MPPQHQLDVFFLPPSEFDLHLKVSNHVEIRTGGEGIDFEPLPVASFTGLIGINL